jgi:hypothetical protein
MVACVGLAACGSGPAGRVSPSTTCAPSVNGGACGAAGFDQLKQANERYADRMPTTGDTSALPPAVTRVRAALAPVAAQAAPPTVDAVRSVLTGLFPGDFVQVSTNAVRMAGTAFGIGIAGNCVFGQIYDHQLVVQSGGPINDGGCLAEYGH